MPRNATAARLEWLNLVRERAATRRATSSLQLENDIELLASLINEIDPIKRSVAWSIETIEAIAALQNWDCPQCGLKLRPLSARQHHVDHLVPWSLGGGNEFSNIRILHEWCNLTKGRRYDYDLVSDYLEGRLRNT